PLHGALQQLLAVGARARESDAADRVARGAHLQLCRDAVPEPDRAGMGRGPRAGGARPRRQPDWAESVGAGSRAPLGRFTLTDHTATASTPVDASRAARPDTDVVIECSIRELYYGSFKAVRDTAIPIEKNSITAFI